MRAISVGWYTLVSSCPLYPLYGDTGFLAGKEKSQDNRFSSLLGTFQAKADIQTKHAKAAASRDVPYSNKQLLYSDGMEDDIYAQNYLHMIVQLTHHYHHHQLHGLTAAHVHFMHADRNL